MMEPSGRFAPREQMMTAAPPLFSVVIPSFNQGLFLKQTLDSIFAQGIPEIEILVIDGGSTDQTVQILKSYGTRVFWISEKDRGQTEAINKGLRLAKGRYLTYLNSDDYYLPGALLRVKEFFEKNPDTFWVSGDYQIVNKDGKPIQAFVIWYKRFLRSLPFSHTLRLSNFIIQPSTFWRKEVVQVIGLFDETFSYALDYDYWLRMSKEFVLANVPYELSAFRIHQASKGGTQFRAQFFEELRALKKDRCPLWWFALHWIHNWGIILAYRFLKGG